jgi:hypothetical protein
MLMKPETILEIYHWSRFTTLSNSRDGFVISSPPNSRWICDFQPGRTADDFNPFQIDHQPGIQPVDNPVVQPAYIANANLEPFRLMVLHHDDGRCWKS